jgi:anti-sigma B factor antagonist
MLRDLTRPDRSERPKDPGHDPVRGSRLSTRFEVVRDCPVFHVGGILDTTTAPTFRHDVNEVIASGYKNLVLDVSGLTFMDSSGIGALIYAYRSLLDQSGKDLWLAGCNEQVKALLEVTQLDRQFRCFGCLAEALTAWGNARSR